MEWKAAQWTAQEAVDAMLSMPYEPSRNFKTIWPSMWCEFASIAIAEALRVRALGDWTFVQAGRPGETSGHAWLEYPSDSGKVEYSIDATLHQFARYDEPYFGPGRTPAAAEFTTTNFKGAWRDWPALSFQPLCYAFADATLRQMGEFN
ncbi:hypothetical protein [Cryobacterium sp. TMT1-66-1]|uniref:hypothetical protein n=1 Tax=Cryobacterium sp. TMT1-66-1 TaxID=1259242 RepID=UPI0010696469|nr:hypothetical protein [Cryobacterium sp. TMT1-66-1]TFD04116.1 hypothetical protein E3T29_15800 [Cryobacterium sp. TMT1-66-1]